MHGANTLVPGFRRSGNNHRHQRCSALDLPKETSRLQGRCPQRSFRRKHGRIRLVPTTSVRSCLLALGLLPDQKLALVKANIAKTVLTSTIQKQAD